MDNNDVVTKQSTQKNPTSPLFPVLAGFIAEPFDTENSLTTPLLTIQMFSHTKPLSISKNKEMLKRVISAAC